MRINKKFGDKIELTWIDACHIIDVWKSIDEAINIPNEVFVFTRCWYVSHNKDFITVCRDKGKTINNDVGGVFHIPIGCIKKIR